jgi:hypothetical protein
MERVVQMVLYDFPFWDPGPGSLLCQTICTICTICTTLLPLFLIFFFLSSSKLKEERKNSNIRGEHEAAFC